MLLINDRLHDIDLADAMPRLSEERRRKLLQLRNENERRASAASYLLLCRCLQQKYGIDELPIMEYGQYGKPRIVEHENVHFNLSHCRCAVICAVSVPTVTEIIGMVICTLNGVFVTSAVFVMKKCHIIGFIWAIASIGAIFTEFAIIILSANLVIAAVVLLLSVANKDRKLKRPAGAIMLGLYAVYFIYLVGFTSAA